VSRENLLRQRESRFDDKFTKRLFDQIEALLHGRANNKGAITLTANVATTTVNNAAFESAMIPVFTPLTANAAAEMDGMYISARTNGQFTITHANDANTDKSFEYIFVG